ncbi:MAG: hypothetical protein INR69_04515 [Mucilaginibacter polytrichastri]|nr:hypothetical protein [Mucilaginibacter polytrichastri]
MKRRYAPLFLVIFLLSSFISGQWLAFSHQHIENSRAETHHQVSKHAVSLNTHCPVCDQLMHYQLDIALQNRPVFFSSEKTGWPEAVFNPHFRTSFTGADRAPPLS